MADLDRALDEIRRRDWDKMRLKWIAEIAAIPDITAEPEQSLGKTAEVIAAHGTLHKQQVLVELQLRDAIETFVCKQKATNPKPKPTDAQLKQVRDQFIQNKRRQLFVQLQPLQVQIPSIWTTIFPEAVRLLHKALHVLGCAEIDADLGMRSWSLCSGYQAALFAGRALLAFCGIGLTEVGSKTLIVDAFPGPVQRPEEYIDVRISYVSAQLNHMQVWNLIQRILGVTVCALWPKDAINKLKSVDVRSFAKQRNEIHYDNLFWPLDDLYEFRTGGSFGTIEFWNVSSGDIDFEREDVSMVIGYYVLRLVLILLSDLATYSNKLAPEIDRIRSCLVEPRHPFYYANLPIGE